MPLSDTDQDTVIRTMLGEAGDQGRDGQAAVANVILNRLQDGSYGNTAAAVATAPDQFQAWNNPSKLNAIDPTSLEYMQAQAILNGVVSGQIPDATAGATHYYAPALMNGKTPDWAQGQQPTARIGGHVFFAPQGAVTQSTGIVKASPDDVAQTAKMLGLPSSVSYVPVSSGGGITISLPVSDQSTPAPAQTAQAPISAATGIQTATPDDVAETMRRLGISQSQATPAAPSAATGTAPSAPAPPTLPPDIQAEASQQEQNLGFPEAMVAGMPIIAPLFNRAAAATGAAIQGMTGQGPQTFGERYARNLQVQNAAQAMWNAAHPMESFVGNMVGGGLLLGPVGGTDVGAAALGLPNATRFGATVGGRLYTGAAGGAAIGATDNALRGDDPISGALVGGAGGAVGPVLSNGVGRLAEGAINALQSVPGALAGINSVGRGWLADALTNETPQSIVTATERMGPQGFVADVNPATTELAAGIANRPEPPASSAIGEAYRQREAQQPVVIRDALNRAFGGWVNIEQFRNMIAENRAAAADPLYTQWRSMQVEPTPALEKLMPRLQAVGAFDEARFLSSATGHPLNLPGGEGETSQVPTTQTWDLVKRGLDSKIEQAYAASNKTRAAALVGLKNELIDEIGKTPAGQVWNQARSEFADRSELLDQIAAGQDTFLGSRSGLSADQLREELKGLSWPGLAARIVGARNAADEVLGATLRGDTTLRNKFLAPNNQEKLRLLLGGDRAQGLIDTLEQQQYLSGQAKYINPRAGSPTAPRSAAINALAAPPSSQYNPDVLKPLSWVPPSWLDALRPSTILQGGREAAYGAARQQVVPALLTRGNRISDLIAGIRQEEANRRGAARVGRGAANSLLAGLLLPGTNTLRTRSGFNRRTLSNALSAGAL